MPAYVIGEVQITNPAGMKGYGPMVAAAVKQYGGRYLARGSTPEVLEGGPAHNILIIEFDDIAAAKRWFNSPEYAAAKAIRQGSSNLRLIVVDSFVKEAT
ncbi:MAG: DUF1330 domain-containing protein [Alphaproteobacteria bacterium]